MDNNQLDHTFKKYFDNRNIAPSAKSWDRLDAMLSVNEKPQTRFRFPYYLVAACFITIMSVAFFWLFNVETINSKTESIAESASKADDPIVSNIKTPSVKIEEEVNIYESPITISKEKMPTAKIIMQENIGYSNMKNIDAEYKKNTGIVNTYAQPLGSEQQTHQKSKLEINGAELLQDVESTLVSVNKNKISKEANQTYRPDPALLLMEAETVAKKSFFKRVYKSLHENAENLIVGVANRNYHKTEAGN